ncbi:hypothetical protein BMF35_a0352 [Aurantiacibacter gangjinensis]|nr:hypothetical protein BMF35_a0352 [Aurantiacibacter gangjinensis]
MRRALTFAGFVILLSLGAYASINAPDWLDEAGVERSK